MAAARCGRRDRPRAGARHARVAVALDVVVDRPGAAGGEVAAEHRPEDRRERRAGRVGDEHRRDRRQQEQRDDPRLGQRDVVAGDWPSAGAHGGATRSGPASGARGSVARPGSRALSRRELSISEILGGNRRLLRYAGGRAPDLPPVRGRGEPSLARASPTAASGGEVGDDQSRVLAGPDVERAEQDLGAAGSRARPRTARSGRRAARRRAGAAGSRGSPQYTKTRWVRWMSARRRDRRRGGSCRGRSGTPRRRRGGRRSTTAEPCTPSSSVPAT